jgi:hypothetical protein
VLLFGVYHLVLSVVYVTLVLFFYVTHYLYFKGLAIKVQEQKRDDAFNRLVPAAASVIRNWWRLRCAQHNDRFVATWKIYALIQRRANALTPTENVNVQSAPPTHTNPFRFNSNTLSKATSIRRKSITCFEDLPKRYVTAIKILRILKYSSACKKFHQAKNPMDLKDIVNENTQVNNRLSMMLNEIQRRLDLALGTTRPASYLSEEQKRQLSLSARIEKVEQVTNQFETKLNYLEQLAIALKERD